MSVARHVCLQYAVLAFWLSSRSSGGMEPDSDMLTFLRSKGFPGDERQLNATAGWLEQIEVACA